MTAALPTDIIVQRCDDQKWQYSAPIENLDDWVSANTDLFDPKAAHQTYWPDRPYPAGMEILIIDGGTTQAPVIARTNPGAKVTATVHTKESLDHAIYLKHQYGLGNLELTLRPVDEVASLNRTFDLVVASGAIQQAGYSETQLAMKALAEVLRPDGVAAFLLFSRYISSFPDDGYRPIDTERRLHTGDVNFSVEDCLNLVEGAGLVFQDWMLKSAYYLPALIGSNDEHLNAIAHLPQRKMWSVLEPLRNQTGCHAFTACRPERPSKSYRIDFEEAAALDFIPTWRPHSGLDGRHAVRPGWSIPLGTVHQEMAQKIDGYRTIRQIAGPNEPTSLAIALIKELWQTDFVNIRFNESASGFGFDLANVHLDVAQGADAQ